MSIHRLIPFVCAGLLLTGFAQKPKLTVRFHVEAIGNAGGSFTLPAKFVNPPRAGYIESVPFATDKNVKGIFPVSNADGTIGCAFKLDQSGAIALRAISTDRRGASVIGFVSSKTGSHQLLDLPIDRPIVDGLIYIPSGFTALEIAMLQKLFPTIKSRSEGDEKPKNPGFGER